MMALASFIAFFGLAATAQAFNNPSDVKVWCGKAYMASNASFNPGGQLVAPKPASSPMLDLKVRPRMSLYTSEEQTGSFVVDAGLSYIHGQPYVDSGSDGRHTINSTTNALVFDILMEGAKSNGDQTLVSQKNVWVNTTSNEFNFSLATLKPQTKPYRIQLVATERSSKRSWTASTDLYYLPARNDGGSATKVDSLYGGLLVQDFTKGSKTWELLYPYSYYASWSGYFQNNASSVSTYKSLGYNIVHVVPDGSVPLGFDADEFNTFLDECDKVGLWVMYDMRWSYLNTSAVVAQVKEFMRHPSMLLWYTADEPDGATDRLNGTKLAYDAIKATDAYHPVSLVLNCANFYYDEYTKGADIVLQDAYPVGINASYSVEWHTPCNSTYGDCGCDDCHGSFRDVSDRLDSLGQYQTWLGGSATSKPLWGVPQAFDGSNEYWARAPNAAEEIVMDLLSVNHGAKGLVAWTWPTEPDLADVTSKFAKVLTTPQVTSFLLGSKLTPVTGVSGAATAQTLDIASWTKGTQMLLSVSYLQTKDAAGQVRLKLPAGQKAKSVASTLWGPGGWSVVGGGDLVKSGLKGLETAILIVTLA